MNPRTKLRNLQFLKKNKFTQIFPIFRLPCPLPWSSNIFKENQFNSKHFYLLLQHKAGRSQVTNQRKKGKKSSVPSSRHQYSSGIERQTTRYLTIQRFHGVRGRRTLFSNRIASRPIEYGIAKSRDNTRTPPLNQPLPSPPRSSSILLTRTYTITEEEASTWRFSYLIVDCHAKRRTSYWLGVGCYTLLHHSISRVSSRRRKNIYIYIYTHVPSSLLCASAPLAYRGISRLLVVVGRMRRDKFRDRSNGDAVSMLLPFAFSTFDTNPLFLLLFLLSLFIYFLGCASSSLLSSFRFLYYRRLDGE